jgi:hypothetical protein
VEPGTIHVSAEALARMGPLRYDLLRNFDEHSLSNMYIAALDRAVRAACCRHSE